VVITDTVVVNGQTFTAIKQRATGTLTAVSAVVGDVCVVGGITFTGVAGATGVGKPTNFSIDTSDTAAAADLVTQINAHPSLSGIVTATSVAGVVTVRAVTSGTAGNSIVLTGTAVRLAASGSGVLAGGIAVANNQFDVSPGGTNDQVAVDLARAINASTTTLVASYVRAQRTASGVVTVWSLISGRAGNGISLTTTGGTITASSALLAGATLADLEGTQASCTLTLASVLNAQTVTINGVVYTANTNTQANDQFDISGTDTQDAANLCLAINNSTTAGSAEIIATSSGAVVTVKARKGGIAGNLITVAVSNATVTIGGSAASGRLGGGAAATTVVPAAERLSGGVGGDATSPAVFQF
jgi:phage tail sheath gpL-like